MFYISTRGSSQILNFKEVTLTGLASDGGLYVPKNWSNIKFLKKKKNLSFQDIIYSVVSEFVENSIDKNTLNIVSQYFKYLRSSPETKSGVLHKMK